MVVRQYNGNILNILNNHISKSLISGFPIAFLLSVSINLFNYSNLISGTNYLIFYKDSIYLL